MRPQRRVVFLPVGLPLLTTLEVSVSTVFGVAGSKELVSTVRAPPRMLVWRPPLAVVRDAQPEARRSTEHVRRSVSLVFMGTGVGRWAVGDGFASLEVEGSGRRCLRV